MKQILLLTLFVLLLSVPVIADNRYGVFPIYDDVCGISEEDEETTNETEFSEEIPDKQELNDESLKRSSGGTCMHEWICSEWEPCNSRGYQTRQCEDKWQCEEIRKLPQLYRECETESNMVIEVEETIDSNQEQIINIPEQEKITPSNNNAITGAVIGGMKTTWLWLLIPLGLTGFLLLLAYRKKSN